MKNSLIKKESNPINVTDENPLAIAKKLSKSTPKTITNSLTNYFSKNTEFALNVSKDLLEITKGSMKGKNAGQARFISLCNQVINNCNEALKKDDLSDKEKTEIRKSITNVINIVNKSNERYQRDVKEIIFKILKIGGIVIVILLGIIPAIVFLPITITGIVVFGIAKIKGLD